MSINTRCVIDDDLFLITSKEDIKNDNIDLRLNVTRISNLHVAFSIPMKNLHDSYHGNEYDISGHIIAVLHPKNKIVFYNLNTGKFIITFKVKEPRIFPGPPGMFLIYDKLRLHLLDPSNAEIKWSIHLPIWTSMNYYDFCVLMIEDDHFITFEKFSYVKRIDNCLPSDDVYVWNVKNGRLKTTIRAVIPRTATELLYYNSSLYMNTEDDIVYRMMNAKELLLQGKCNSWIPLITDIDSINIRKKGNQNSTLLFNPNGLNVTNIMIAYPEYNNIETVLYINDFIRDPSMDVYNQYLAKIKQIIFTLLHTRMFKRVNERQCLPNNLARLVVEMLLEYE